MRKILDYSGICREEEELEDMCGKPAVFFPTAFSQDRLIRVQSSSNRKLYKYVNNFFSHCVNIRANALQTFLHDFAEWTFVFLRAYARLNSVSIAAARDNADCN